VNIKNTMTSSNQEEELSVFKTATKRFQLDKKQAQTMFAHALLKQLQREGTLEKVETIRKNQVVQQAMKENYVKFVEQSKHRN
jgi:hypothetical protein